MKRTLIHLRCFKKPFIAIYDYKISEKNYTIMYFHTQNEMLVYESECHNLSQNFIECPKDWKSFGENCYMLLSKNRNRDSAQVIHYI